MSENTATEPAASSNASEVKESLSPDSWAIKRAKELEARTKPPSQPTATPTETTEAQAEVTEPATQEPAPEEDVLSKLGIDSSEKLDAVIEALTKQEGNKSRLLDRLKELNAERKAEKTRAEQLQEELQRIRAEQPKAESNPYATVTDAEKIAALEQQSADVLDWADELLAVNELAGANDPVYDRQGNPVTFDGKQWTKLMVRDAMRNAKNALAKHLPAQRKAVEAIGKREELKRALMEQASKELPWFAKEDDPVKQKYEAMLKEVGIEQIEATVPDAAPRLRHALAHAANSLYGRKVIADSGIGRKPSLTPPSNPGSGAAKSSQPEARVSAALRELEQRYKTTGSEADYIAFRAAQRTNRV